MGGGGSIQGMIIALRNNKNLLSKRKSLHEQNQSQKTSGIKSGLNCDIEATDEQLLEIRTRIRKRNKRKKIFNSLIITTSVLIVLYLSFLNSKKDVLYEKSVIEIKAKEKTYKNYIQYGDTWLEDKKYNAAIYNYQKAVDLAPSDYHANYRLALAYSYICSKNKLQCNEGTLFIDKLIAEFGSNSELEYLKGIFDNR